RPHDDDEGRDLGDEPGEHGGTETPGDHAGRQLEARDDRLQPVLPEGDAFNGSPILDDVHRPANGVAGGPEQHQAHDDAGDPDYRRELRQREPSDAVSDRDTPAPDSSGLFGFGERCVSLVGGGCHLPRFRGCSQLGQARPAIAVCSTIGELMAKRSSRTVKNFGSVPPHLVCGALQLTTPHTRCGGTERSEPSSRGGYSPASFFSSNRTRIASSGVSDSTSSSRMRSTTGFGASKKVSCIFGSESGAGCRIAARRPLRFWEPGSTASKSARISSARRLTAFGMPARRATWMP